MMKTRPPWVPILLAILAVLAGTGAYAAWISIPPRPAFHGTTYEEIAPAAPIALRDPDGRAVSLASLRGRPVLVFFGYTKCPDLCPLTLDRAARAVREAKSDARILFVTVDPANDTPDALRRFAARFHGAVTPLTGDSAALAGAWKGYGVYVIPPTTAPAAVHAGHLGHAPAPGQLTHSGVVYGIDRRGDLRVVITEGAPEDQIRDDVETLTRL